MGAGIAKGQAGRGRRRGRRRDRNAPMSEINVTPFVDVMLVLLVVFMVTAPLLTVGVPVELPKTSAQALPGSQEEPLSVTIPSDGSVRIQDTPVDPARLVTRLRAIAAERDSERVYLRADGAVPYSRVMEVMGAMNGAGFSDVALVTDSGGPSLDGSDGQGAPDESN